jgi:hypothetical protein
VRSDRRRRVTEVTNDRVTGSVTYVGQFAKKKIHRYYNLQTKNEQEREIKIGSKEGAMHQEGG